MGRGRGLANPWIEGAVGRKDGGRIGCGGSLQRSNTIRMQKALVYPRLVCSSDFSPVEAALGTLSQQKHWGWPWLKLPSTIVPLS